MLLIMVMFMQYEEPVLPSSRLQALGTEFVQLIDDPITDVQIFPARLTFFERPTAYIYPEIPAISGAGILTLTGGLLLPRAAGINAGLWHTFSWYDSKDELVTVDTIDPGIDTSLTKYNAGKQIPSLMLAVPFLKEGGWTALKLSYHDAFANNDNRRHNIGYDTLISGDDTTYHFSDDITHYVDGSKSPLWSITLDQFLPMGDVASLDVAFKYDNANLSTSNSDTSNSSYQSAYINHSGDVRTAYILYNDSKSLNVNESKTKRNTFSLAGIFQRLPSWGVLRIVGRFGYGFGSEEVTQAQDDWDQDIDRYEYSDLDSSHVDADTQVTHTTSSSIEKTDVKQFQGNLGTGLAYYGIENIGFFTGLKLDYTRVLDYPETGETGSRDDYAVTIPIGLEWFPVDCFCLRYGLRCSYQYKREEYGDVSRTIFTHQQVIGNSTIGFGLTAANHLQINFYSKNGYFSTNKDWGLDLQYEF